MIGLVFQSFKSSGPRKRPSRSPRTLRQQPAFDRLEERCLLSTTYTMPPSATPIAEMVYGPAGDIWFSRVGDLSITRIASDGTVNQIGLPTITSQPVGLEVDASDN